MTLFSRCVLSALLIFITSYVPMHLIAQQYAPPVQTYIPPPTYGTTPSEYYYYQSNPYLNNYNANPPYGFYGGFYGSPPPPTPAQAFPDKAAADNLYRYIQSR